MRTISSTTISILAIGLLASATVGTSVSARRDGGCSQGQAWDRVQAFDGGTFLQENITAYLSVQRALDDKVYDEAELEFQFVGSDRNGNGYVCIKDVYEHSSASDRSQGFYHYISVVDDNARAAE